MSIERALVCPDCGDTGQIGSGGSIESRTNMLRFARNFHARKYGIDQIVADMALQGCHTCGLGLDAEREAGR